MRLLNTKTYELKEFFEHQIPEYVILSHRWSDNEVTFKEFCKGRNQESIGYRKIVDFCAFARSLAREWVWVDTCCVDKRSSAELSEAINSMWTWYENARECFAYLIDVPSLESGRDRVLQRLKQSDWFTRGWTLQELIAPPSVVFCNVRWQIVGTRDNLASEIASLCGIRLECLKHVAGPDSQMERRSQLQRVSIAAKMSWMAERRTTRSEDQAYCLLGLFGVNMSLLYGEGGTAAFKRLQLEIIKVSDDESIFAYDIDGSQSLGPPFAETPQAFSGCGSIMCYDDRAGAGWNSLHRKPYAMTNKGLEVHGNAYKYTYPYSSGERSLDEQQHQVYLLPLLCFSSGSRCVMVMKHNGQDFRRLRRTFTQDELDVEMPLSGRQISQSTDFLIR